MIDTRLKLSELSISKIGLLSGEENVFILSINIESSVHGISISNYNRTDGKLDLFCRDDCKSVLFVSTFVSLFLPSVQ